MRAKAYARVNAETGELLGRELTAAEFRAQGEWLEDMRKAREALHQSHVPTDYNKPVSDLEWSRYMQGYSEDRRCDKCFLLLPKSNRCDCDE